MLTISIDTKSKIPIYEQIYIYIRDEIRTGQIACGTKLPSERGLAVHLAVSRNTIDMAYGQLLSEGYIESFPKKGYFVCDLENLYLDQEQNGIELYDDVLEEAEPKQQSEVIDFSPTGVDMRYFPYGKWRRLMKECLIDDNQELFFSGNHQGDVTLRKAVQAYLHQSRGVKCDVNQIVIGAGSDYMLLLLSRIWKKKATVLMENPTYKQAYTIFQSMGYDTVAVDVDEQGIVVEQFERMDADFAYVTPSHHFPLGTVMTASRKQRLLNWANQSENRYIIEDDYDSEFRYFGKPIPALQSQDPFEKVIYLGTLSKAIAPGIRISYMVLPKNLMKQYREVAGFYFCTVSRIDQKVIGEFLIQGHFERHLNRMRKVYKAKHDTLIREIKKANLPVKVVGDGAGLHIVLEYGTQVDDAQKIEQILKEKAWHAGIRVYPIGEYYIEERKRCPAIILGYAKVSQDEIIEGVCRLKAILT